MVKKVSGSKPIFVINPKNEMHGADLVELARIADKAAADFDVQVMLTCSPCDVYQVSVATTQLFVFGQHIDPIASGPTTGKILPEALQSAGAVGTMINHPEQQLVFSEVQKAIARARECDLLSLVFAQTMEQAIAVAHMQADMVMVEEPQFIATNIILDGDYMQKVTQTVQHIKRDMLVLQGAGIKSGEDVYKVIVGGVQGTGSSSGIFKAEHPETMVVEMIKGARLGWDARSH